MHPRPRLIPVLGALAACAWISPLAAAPAATFKVTTPAEFQAALTTAAGNRRRLDYLAGPEPVFPVPLQEVFGCRETPSLCNGRVPVMLHLLSPAGRPVQITRDLAGFWARSYAEVRKELRGRYPKHAWPEDPLTATPVTKVRGRRRD